MPPGDSGFFEVVWPQSERRVARQPLAPRLDRLDGKRVAQVWDYLFRGDQAFDYLEGQLSPRFPGLEFISWREFGNIHGQDERQVLADLPRRLRERGADAAILGMAC